MAFGHDGGIVTFGRGRVVRPYNRLPHLRLILALSFRASDRRHWRGNPFPFHVNGGPWPLPTFAALRQRRDLIIAQTPG